MSFADPQVVIRNGESCVDLSHEGRTLATINMSNILRSLIEAIFRPDPPVKELEP